MADLGKIKGAAFREFLLWHAARNTEAVLVDATERVPAELRSELDVARPGLGVLASRWYPAELVHALLDALVAGRTASELDALALDAAEVIMGRTLRGVYRTLFSMLATPDRYQQYGGKLWGQHYDSGRLVFTSSEPGRHRIEYVGWRGHHPFICRLNCAASVPIYSAMGCEQVAISERQCVADGSVTCGVAVRWSEGRS